MKIVTVVFAGLFSVRVFIVNIKEDVRKINKAMYWRQGFRLK